MHQRPAGVRGLVFGGIMAALVILCLLVPFFNVFLPIPLVLAYVRYGGRVAVLTGAVSVLFSAMLVGPVQAILAIPGGILPGLVFGYGFRHNLRPLAIGIVAVLVFFLGSAATYVITRVAVLGGRDPIAGMVQSEPFRQMMDPFVAAMEKAAQHPPNATPEQIKVIDQQAWLLREYRSDPVAFMWAMLPTALFLGGAFNSWLNYSISRWILPRFGHEVPRPTPFREFRLPAWLIWVYVLGSLATDQLGGINTLVNAPWWTRLLFNVLAPLQYLFVLAGLAVAYGFLRGRNLTKPVSLLIIVMVFALGGLGFQLFLMLAVWDTIFDIRGLGHGLWKRPSENP